VQDSPIPSATDQYEYLLRLYFGSDSDRLSSCIARAYRDFNRTLHGFGQVSESKGIHTQGSAVVRSFLTGLVDSGSGCRDQESFDDRHKNACTNLCSTYSRAGFDKFRVGQAQKWLNMALKYVFVFREKRLPGYSPVFNLAHIPLDNIILDSFRKRHSDAPCLGTAWSRISSYEEYMGVQRWVRSTFPNSVPLAVEFALWQRSGGSPFREESPG
jgi:hypothetical protein